MKKLALTATAVALAVAVSSGPARADTVPNQTFTVVKIGPNPGTVAGIGVVNGLGVDNNIRLQAPRGAQFQPVFTFPQ